jgi:hypothetical protein
MRCPKGQVNLLQIRMPLAEPSSDYATGIFGSLYHQKNYPCRSIKCNRLVLTLQMCQAKPRSHVPFINIYSEPEICSTGHYTSYAHEAANPDEADRPRVGCVLMSLLSIFPYTQKKVHRAPKQRSFTICSALTFLHTLYVRFPLHPALPPSQYADRIEVVELDLESSRPLSSILDPMDTFTHMP